MYTEDTIAAIVTAPGEAGVAIVRVSGPEAFAIADRVFTCDGPKPSERPANSLVYGQVCQDGEALDEAILLLFKNPQSFTAEDVIEIQGHGGPLISKRVLRAVLEAGARVAEPGEFTRRAFLNGRIDLLQAEAVLDLIQARSERSASAALDQLEGGLSRAFEAHYEQLIGIAADIEATLDFPEEDLPAYVIPKLAERLKQLEADLSRQICAWEEGHLLRDGALVVISGKPNVGKSTLLNLLLGSDRAIVSHHPGTTRDHIEESMTLKGIPLRIIDTAGLRETDCEIEREGVARSRVHIEKADLHLHVLDVSTPPDEESLNTLNALPQQHTIIVLNKTDLGSSVDPALLNGKTTVKTSLIQGDGVEDVRQAIAQLLEQEVDLSAPPHAVISERHRKLLVDARQELQTAHALLVQNRPDLPALSAAHLRDALDLLGQVTGRTYEEELLDNIFSRFCVGK